MKALLVVDVNKFFLESAPEDFATKIADHISQSGYDLVAFTTFKNQPGSNFEKSLNWTKCASDEDAALPNELSKFADKSNVFVRSSFSAFSETVLHEFLQDNNVEDLYLCGIDTDACVLATAFSAFDKGYKVRVKFDLSFSGNNLHKEAKEIIEQTITPQDKYRQS